MPIAIHVRDSFEEAIKIVEEIGYPVIIKASAGGGGRGMRVVNSSDELWQSIQSAQNEAELAFGDGKIFAKENKNCQSLLAF